MGLLKKLLNKFWTIHRGLVRRNLTYKNIHKDQTCLIFGNGVSLKYYDLTALKKKYISMGCSYSLADQRIATLGMDYCITSDSYLLYPLRKDSYSGEIIFNLIGPILKKIIRKNTATHFFTSLTNYYSFIRKPSNLSFFHHFGDITSDNYDLAGKFSYVTGALDIMLGTAKYMGFSKVILLGCDYLGSPKLEGHFYAEEPDYGYGDDDPSYAGRIKKVAGNLDVLAIFPKGISCTVFKSATFEEYFGLPEFYQSNTKILQEEYLVMMRKAATGKQIWM
jgi:hypothetical protein